MAGPDAAIVTQYEDQFEHMFQQRIERLRRYVRVKTGVTGSMTAFGLLEPSSMTDITADRHGDTNWHDSVSLRRWAVKSDFEDAQIIDRQDTLQIIVDLEMGYAQNSSMAAARKIDEIILAAVIGPAASGVNGVSTSTFLTTAPIVGGTGGNRIASGGTGLTVDKLREARRVFNEREVGVDDLAMGIPDGFVLVISAKQMQDLMEETEATSGDYVGQGTYTDENGRRMPLVDGYIRYYMGFRLQLSTGLPLVGVERQCLAWHRSAIGLAIWQDRLITIDRLPTKHNARGIILQMHMGAVRIHDKGVLAILCAE